MYHSHGDMHKQDVFINLYDQTTSVYMAYMIITSVYDPYRCLYDAHERLSVYMINTSIYMIDTSAYMIHTSV